MDGSSSVVGEGPEVMGRRSQALNRIARGISPMRRMFGGENVDRRLVRQVVSAFAVVKGWEYEAAHKVLTLRAGEIGFDNPEQTSDGLLTRRTVEARRRISLKRGQQKILRENFADDGKGETVDLTAAELERSQRGGR